jgi:hypothetical protein
MQNPLWRATLLFQAILLPHAALAQQRILPGGLILSGYWATCGPIETEVLKINDIAASSGGRIILNPSLFALPRSQQLFWYTHECGHQIFGPSEAVADCWSVEQGRIQGWLNRSEFEQLATVIGRFRGDATHGDGPERAAHLRLCYYR